MADTKKDNLLWLAGVLALIALVVTFVVGPPAWAHTKYVEHDCTTYSAEDTLVDTYARYGAGKTIACDLKLSAPNWTWAEAAALFDAEFRANLPYYGSNDEGDDQWAGRWDGYFFCQSEYIRGQQGATDIYGCSLHAVEEWPEVPHRHFCDRPRNRNHNRCK